MKIFGIDFEPTNTPLHKHVETISAVISFYLFTVYFVVGYALTLYLLLFTSYWVFGALYLLWIWIDAPTTKTGGRRSEWVRGWKLFKYATDYYPISLIVKSTIKLEPKRNYMFCAFPHAIYPSGTMISLATKACGVDHVFPDHIVYPATLDVNLNAPFFRDFLMALGMRSVSSESFNYILNKTDGGKILLVIVGGATEALLSHPENYCIFLRNRKGFVKMAIKTGTPLVPVYGFGEVNAFSQYTAPDGSWFQKFQLWLKNWSTIAVPLICGRGIFQKSFGSVPHRTPINVVVGKPIDVEKNENPSREEVEDLHQVFMNEMTNLFDEYKYKYIKNAENIELIIV